MKTFHYYNSKTGIFTGRATSSSGDRFPPDPVEGCDAIEGVADPESQRVDVETGELVDYQPPQPSPDHEWDADLKRWVLKPEVLEAQAAEAEALAKINLQEAGSLRAIRELLLNPDNTEARAKLQAVDDAIAAERPKIIVKGEIVEQPVPVEDLKAAP